MASGLRDQLWVCYSPVSSLTFPLHHQGPGVTTGPSCPCLASSTCPMAQDPLPAQPRPLCPGPSNAVGCWSPAPLILTPACRLTDPRHPHSPAWPTRVVADPGAPHQALILTPPQPVPMKVPVDDNSSLPLAAIIPCRPCSLPQVLWDRPCPAAMLWLPAPLPQGAASLHRSLPALHLLISSF